jgi:hypothetical protein
MGRKILRIQTSLVFDQDQLRHCMNQRPANIEQGMTPRGCDGMVEKRRGPLPFTTALTPATRTWRQLTALLDRRDVKIDHGSS